MDTLREIANSFDLELLMPINQVLIQYTDLSQDTNSVLDLMFLYANTQKFNNYFILTDIQKPSDHVLSSVYIIIKEEFIQEKKLCSARDHKLNSCSKK